MMLQGAEVVCGSQGVLEIPAGCLERSVVRVEGELSFGKSAPIEVSKGVVGCHQRYLHTRVQNDPVFLELPRNKQQKEAHDKHSRGVSWPTQKNQPALDTLHLCEPGLRPYLQVHSGRLHQHPGLVTQRG